MAVVAVVLVLGSPIHGPFLFDVALLCARKLPLQLASCERRGYSSAHYCHYHLSSTGWVVLPDPLRTVAVVVLFLLLRAAVVVLLLLAAENYPLQFPPPPARWME